MGLTMLPLTAELIDEGEMLEELDIELAKAQQLIEAFRKRWEEKSEKAAVELNLRIRMVCIDPTEGMYRTEWDLQTKRPKRPKAVSSAIASQDDAGKAALFVRSSGSDDSDPRQLKLSTRDGRTIDPVTGAVEE